jgi:hypothetical protein
VDNIIHNSIAAVRMRSDLIVIKRSNDMDEFRITQLFGFIPKAHNTVLRSPIFVCWAPPPPGCLKINIDGSAFGSPSSGAIGIVFRNS